jgi:integrase
MPVCPECGSKKTWKDGFRYVQGEPIQRYLCRKCGYRFSESNGFSRKITNSSYNKQGSRQICVSESEMKNLVAVETKQKTAGETTKQNEIKSKLIEYSWFMKKQGYREGAIISYTDRIRHIHRKGAVLSDPEHTKKTIAGVESWSDGSKKCMADAYDVYVRMEGLQWEKPKYNPRSSLPFIPTEKEIDQLIGGCGLKIRVFLQGLKETGAGGGELFHLQWIDIDFKRKKITINHPTKGHNPRILNVSDDWLRMVSKLPRTSERVWNTRYDLQSANFRKQRKRLAREYSNPRLRKISFRTLRHWKGTTLYHKTHDVYQVKKVLGHKKLSSTEIYINLEETLFQQIPNEFIVRRAVSAKGMMSLAAVGFEKFDEVNGVHLYRKPKELS